jgi:hypothetical protein
MKAKVFFGLLVFVCLNSIHSTTYYSKSAGTLSAVGTWGVNTDGSGAAPANFTTAGNTFIVVNNVAPTVTAAWTVSGAGSVIQVGDGTQLINFTIPTAFRVSATINVTSSSTLTINNATNPILGTLSSGSTVVYSDAAAQPVLNATYYNLTLGGTGTKTLANVSSSVVTNSLTINAGIIFQLSTTNTVTLTLNGTLSGTGKIKGGNTSNLTIGGSGNFGTIIPSGAALTINNFVINRTSLGSITLGGNITARASCNFSNGVLVLNGHTLSLAGTLTFPTASTNGTITGSATSNISITATSITNNLFMTTGAQTLNNLTLNASAGQTLTLGNSLTVTGAYLQTRGIVNLNGNTLTLNGTSATFASSAANGTTTGSATSNLIISATTIGANSLFMTVGSQTLNNLTLNSPATQVLILGTRLTINGAYTQTSGIVSLNGQILTLNGAITFPAASANGTITGTATSDLIINATSITNNLFMTAAGSTLRNLTLNSPGQTLTLGSALTVGGALTQTNGVLNINGNTLTLSGTIVFPVASTNGTITGSATSNLSITATSITNDLYMTSGAQTLNNLTLNATAGQTLILGTDLTVSGAYLQTKGIVNLNGHTLNLSGTATFASSVANGTTTGSATSNLIITATTIGANSLFMTAGAQTLNNLTLNSSGQTLTLGTPLTVSGAYTQTNGIVKLNAQTLTLTGVIIFPAASANGTITGSNTSNLSVSGTSVTNTLFFTAAALALNNFAVNSAGQTLKLGTALTLAGTFTHTNGIIDLNGQTLTCNGPVVFPASVANGSFTGSSLSSLSIATPAGGAITNSMYMTQTSASTNSLLNVTLNRTGGTLTLGNQLNLIGALIPTAGTFASAGNLTLIASSATVSAYIGTIGATGGVTGNITTQVYEAGPNTGWTLMGSPGLTGRTMADWNNTFFITCPICPEGDGTTQNGTPFTSIDAYSETAGGLLSATPRYIGISNITNAINVGQGYWVYLGTAASTTSDILINMTGAVSQGNVTIPLTITNIGGGTNATDHGYNLIANPYPAPISWTSLRTPNAASVSATLYVYNPDLNGYATFISTSGVSSPAVGAGGIGDKIPAGQGFYVKASAANTLTVKETFKAASNQQLLRVANPNAILDTTPVQPMLFRLQASGNSMKNETVIYFDPNATTYYNADYDAISLGVDPGFLGIVSDLSDTAYTIKGLPPLTQNISMPIKTVTGITGSYQIVGTDLQNLPSGACIRLHDKYLNIDWDLRTGPYNCTLNDTETVARFVLNITIDPTLSVASNFKNPTCAKSANGYMIANPSGSAPWNYYWKDANSNIIKTSLNKTTADTLLNANSGSYIVNVSTVGSCNNGTANFTLQGSLSASAMFTASTTVDSLINDTISIYFTNTSSNASSYLWDFGDGSQSTANNISHTYTGVGTYVVSLSAYDQPCGDTSVYYQTITVDASSSTAGIKSITSIQKNSMAISRDATGYYVQFNYQTKTNAVISVQNLLGEKIVADIKQENVANNKTYVPLGNSENNVLIISVNTSSGEKTFRKVINY